MQQVGEQLRHISELVGFQAVDGPILGREGLKKSTTPALVNQAEPSRDHPVVPQEGALLRTTLDNHVDEFRLPARGDVHLGQFVGALLKSGR